MIIKTGYKLFEMRDDNKLFPLFIGKTKETPMNEWIMAEGIPTKGFAPRFGWHIGKDLPSAVHLMSYDGTYKSQRGKHFRRVWAEVQYCADVDYTEEALKIKKKCFTDKLPTNGFYLFKENNNAVWIIADRIRVTKILSENERQQILKEMNYDEAAAFHPYHQAMAKRMKVI